MAGSEASLASAMPVATSVTEEEVMSMHRFIENALDLLLKVNPNRSLLSPSNLS